MSDRDVVWALWLVVTPKVIPEIHTKKFTEPVLRHHMEPGSSRRRTDVSAIHHLASLGLKICLTPIAAAR